VFVGLGGGLGVLVGLGVFVARGRLVTPDSVLVDGIEVRVPGMDVLGGRGVVVFIAAGECRESVVIQYSTKLLLKLYGALQ